MGCRSHTLQASGTGTGSFGTGPSIGPRVLQGSSSGRGEETGGGAPSSLGPPKQMVYTRTQHYRKMNIEWRHNVFLGKSRIHGLGVYAKRPLDKHTMVIEYIGDLIRNELSERREKLYQSQVLLLFCPLLSSVICHAGSCSCSSRLAVE